MLPKILQMEVEIEPLESECYLAVSQPLNLKDSLVFQLQPPGVHPKVARTTSEKFVERYGFGRNIKLYEIKHLEGSCYSV
jgi:hypothetical protein